MSLACAVLASCASRLPQPVVQGNTNSARSSPPVAVESPTAPQPIVPSAPISPARSDSRAEFHSVQKGDTLVLLGMQYGVDYKDIATWNQLENINQLKIGQVLRIAPPGDAIATPITPGAAAPEARVLPGSASATTAQNSNPSDPLKSAPKAIKLPYSAEALAQVQNPALEGLPAMAVAKPSLASPETTTTPAPTSPDEVADWTWPAQGKIKGFFSETNKGLDITGTLGQPVMAGAAGKVIYAGNSVPGMGRLLVIRHSKNILRI